MRSIDGTKGNLSKPHIIKATITDSTNDFIVRSLVFRIRAQNGQGRVSSIENETSYVRAWHFGKLFRKELLQTNEFNE
jgi:hypothetical protein